MWSEKRSTARPAASLPPSPNDRPSATRMFFITSFAKSGINANAVAGYMAPNNTSILVKSGNRITKLGKRTMGSIKEEDKGIVQEKPPSSNTQQTNKIRNSKSKYPQMVPTYTMRPLDQLWTLGKRLG